MRTAEIKRKTKETDIEVFVKLDGEGKVNVDTGIGFFRPYAHSFWRSQRY